MVTTESRPRIRVWRTKRVKRFHKPAPPSPPRRDWPPRYDGDGDKGGKSFKSLALLIFLVVCISAIILMVRRLIISDDQWVNRIDDGATVLIQPF